MNTAELKKQANGLPPCKVVDIGFRWDADRQEHVPSIKVEFEPVKHGEPNDSQGWKDRDLLARMLKREISAQQPLSEEQEREAFEAWVKDEDRKIPTVRIYQDRIGVEYPLARMMFKAFKAGRAHGIGSEIPIAKPPRSAQQ